MIFSGILLRLNMMFKHNTYIKDKQQIIYYRYV